LVAGKEGGGTFGASGRGGRKSGVDGGASSVGLTGFFEVITTELTHSEIDLRKLGDLEGPASVEADGCQFKLHQIGC
jgi:hypothetical protein